MPLIRKTGAPAPKELGLFWQMLTSEGETIEVFVFASTLQAFDSSAVGPVGLLKRHRQLLEEIASAKFDREGGIDRGPLDDWREGRNDLEAPARSLVPVIGEVLDWLKQQPGANFVRMSGSGATCFALFDNEAQRDAAADACPSNWWHLATFLR